jgi:chemotaxis protein methyltransferase CheR
MRGAHGLARQGAAKSAAAVAPREIPLDDGEFRAIRVFLFDAAGISLSDAKKALVGARLGKRLRAHGLGSYTAYLQLLRYDGAERQIALDLLTTNETYFFREPQHFEFLQDQVLPQHRRGDTFRVWSAAASSGEEPYSIAMLLDDKLGKSPWEVVGTDISTQMLGQCRLGRYTLERARNIPKEYLRKYCLKGTGPEEGFLLVERGLQARLRFVHANLNGTLPDVGKFDVIFLRNVMIYFETATKSSLVARLLGHLRPGGWLFIGHSECMHGVNDTVRQLRPAIYQKP